MESSYDGKYTKLERIGAGNYGEIFKVRRNDGEQFIAKHVNLEGMQRQIAMRQLNIIQKIGHPYIVKYIDNFISESQLIIIMEYCGQKDLSYHIKSMKDKAAHFNEQLIINWVLQMLLALDSIHRLKILHRDIKPQNIFVDKDMNIKIGDFGISKILDNSMGSAKTVVGTPYYLAPQICRSQKYTNKADIWSMGCVIYELCALEKPFLTNKGLLMLMEQIKQAKIKRIPQIYSEDLNKIVAKMLTRNSQQRPSARKLMGDQFMVNLMIINTSRIDVKKDYSKIIPKKQQPTFTDSFIQKRTNQVNNLLKNMEQDIKERMEQMKKKQVKKDDIDRQYEAVKKKMKQLEKAVQNAFQQLKHQSQPTSSQPQFNQHNTSILANTIKSSNEQLQSQSSATINSIEMSGTTWKPKSKLNFGGNITSSVESIMVNQKDIGKSFKDMDVTLKSQYATTNKQIQHFLPENTINRLDLLQATLMKNPQALLNQSFMNCTLSMSNDKGLSFKTNHQIQDSINFDFTKKQFELSTSLPKPKGKQELQNSVGQVTQKQLQAQEEIESQYVEDFQQYEAESPHRVQQMNQILSFYQQTLKEFQQKNNQKSMTKTQMVRNKYPLALSLIKEQSNQGGSILNSQVSVISQNSKIQE